MDEFKKYLRENRHMLDVESPPREAVWQNIEQRGSVRKKMVMSPLARWMAAACIVLLTGAATYVLWPSKTGPEVAGTNPETRNTKPDKSIESPEKIGWTD